MAYTQFKGFKRVLSTNTAYSGATHDNFLYFVRDNANDVEGQIWFQGMCYGSCRDSEIDKILEALEGFIPASGEVINVKEYIDEAIAQLESDVTTIELGDGSFSGLTLVEDSSTSGKLDYTLTLTNVAPKDEFDQEKIDRAEADEALEDQLEATAQTLSDAIETEAQAREDADDDLQDQIDELSGATDDLQAEVDRIETAVGLNADGTYVADDGQYVSAATSVLDATAKLNDALVQEVVDRNQAIEDAIDALIGDASESGNTLGELEDRIEELSADAKEYHLVKTTTGLPEAIKERYSLVDADGNVSGDTVDIPKDSHIVSIRYITDSADTHYQNLEYTYLDASGDTKVEYVDMSQLVLETEFASGVSATGGVVHGIVDPQSEAFLTVGADGFKLSGVQDAIDDAKTAATAYTQSEIQKLDVTGDTAVAGQYVAAIEETDGVVAVKTRANVSEAVLNNYAKGSDATAVAATDTVNEAISKLENQVDAAKAAATTKVEKDASANHLTLSSSTAADGSVTYTIGEDDIASKTALDAEIAARKAVDGQNGQTYTANAGANYISGATSLNDADVKLDAALGDLNNNMADLADALEATAATLTDMIEEEAQERAEAIENEASARTAADNALDERLDKIEDEYITAVTVNGVHATVTDNAADVTIQADDIELGEEVTGTTGGIHFDASANTQDVFQSIVDTLNRSVAGSYTGVTSTGNTISVTQTTNGNNIEFLKESATDATVADGHLELAKNGSNEWYGVMYWINEETA